MPSNWSPKTTEVSPDQGDLFSGTPNQLQSDPHFANSGEVAYGVAVSLEARNEALQSAFTWLGRQASSAAFREIGRQQTEGQRTAGVRRLESQYTQEELEEKLETSHKAAKDGIEDALSGKLKKAFGYEELVGSELFPDITEEKAEEAFLSGGGSQPVSGQPGPKEGKKEFEARFKGSNHSRSRHTYRNKLKRQATQIKRVQTRNSQRAA